MAAIELINLLRPIVAISTYITFAALALHHHPECLTKLKESDLQYYDMFAQEVRRYYPFAPLLAGRVKKDFVWKEYYFSKGPLVLLDIYGTNHDSRIWEDPFEFEPERFRNWKGNLYSFIPQGGGAADKTHRCPEKGLLWNS
jgi:fatty-acid peroxygenase